MFALTKMKTFSAFTFGDGVMHILEMDREKVGAFQVWWECIEDLLDAGSELVGFPRGLASL